MEINKTTSREPVNSNASPEARKLLEYFYHISGKKILSGQHNPPAHISEHTNHVYEITGKYPAVWGQDFGFSKDGHDGINNRPAIMEEAKQQYKNGSIINLMWHCIRPIDGETGEFKTHVQGNMTDKQWNEFLTPGTDLHKHWIEQIDTIAEFLKQLNDASLPVLWRPYHEMNGDWFWWGDKKGETGFKKLWIMMYERYVKHHKLNNLLWVWSPNSPHINAFAYKHYYPGHEYVDMLAADVYRNDYKQSHHDDLLTLGKGRPIALGEVGQMPSPKVLDKQPYWVWFLTWAGFLTKKNTTKAILALYNDSRTINNQR